MWSSNLAQFSNPAGLKDPTSPMNTLNPFTSPRRCQNNDLIAPTKTLYQEDKIHKD